MRKKQTIYLFILVGLALSINLKAQKKTQPKKDSTSTVIIFSQSSKPSEVTERLHKKAGESNIIKIAPLGFISGTFPVYYERAITEYFSVQGGLGLTNRNYYREVSFKASESLDFSSNTTNYSSSDLADNLYTFNHRTANMGFMFALQPRFYFDSEGLDGSFFGVGYQNCRYNYTHQGITSAIGTDNGSGVFGGPDKNEHENLSDIFAVFGWQKLHDRISFETTVEAGIRKVNGSKYVAYATDNGNSTYTVTDGFQDYTQTKFYFNIGIKVGYHF